MASEIFQSTRPITGNEEVLRARFVESVVGQSELMDKLAQQLITVELAIPGIYVAVLKLTAGDDATVAADNWLWGALGSWFAALALALISLIPRTWRVDPMILKADAAAKGGVLGLEDFFRRSAAYKRRLLIPSALLFALGVFCAAMLVL